MPISSGGGSIGSRSLDRTPSTRLLLLTGNILIVAVVAAVVDIIIALRQLCRGSNQHLHIGQYERTKCNANSEMTPSLLRLLQPLHLYQPHPSNPGLHAARVLQD